MSFIVCEALHKTYADGTEAVKGIDLACEQGEFVVLLGPSGCGKTTTLRMIAGLEIATAGRILMAGVDITGHSPKERDVGFVFQFYALYPHLKIEENIGFPLESMGIGGVDQKKRVSEIVERLGLGELLGRYPRQLSGGDQQRVALARAMVRQPQMYLMDEPLGTLDADLRLEMRELIRAQQLASGVTTLYVTHDQEEAMSLADRIVVMDGGLIRQNAAAATVY
ncbi:MAG TPA: ABC transporter ATP-binding protein, partial [Candidatus Latescibacteria bacterium]|nr:ABC transporter ATP-binding protein [Candidatus Latescibacterota bacterium]